MKSLRWLLLGVWTFLIFIPPVQPGPVQFDPGLAPLPESKAYRLFQNRPYSDLSKLVYLIDRFKYARISIIYDGLEYQPIFAARLARWFLSTHYHGETAEKWVMLWCNQTYSERRLVWVKDVRENFKLSRELLLEELKQLDEAVRKDPKFQAAKPPENQQKA